MSINLARVTCQELLTCICMRESVHGNRQLERGAQRHPAVTEVPLDEAVGSNRVTHERIVTLERCDACFPTLEMAREARGQHCIEHGMPIAPGCTLCGRKDGVVGTSPPRDRITQREQNNGIGEGVAEFGPEGGGWPTDCSAIRTEELKPVRHVTLCRFVPSSNVFCIVED